MGGNRNCVCFSSMVVGVLVYHDTTAYEKRKVEIMTSKSYSCGAGKSDDGNRRVNDDAARSKSKPFCDAVWGTCICYREAGHEKKGRYSGHWWTVAPQEIQSR